MSNLHNFKLKQEGLLKKNIVFDDYLGICMLKRGFCNAGHHKKDYNTLMMNYNNYLESGAMKSSILSAH